MTNNHSGQGAGDYALRDVQGYCGLYQVTAEGEIRNARTGRILAPYLRRGYPSVTLHRDGTRLVSTVHKLVLEAFAGPRPEGFHGAHLDGDRTNSRPDNLAWVSPSENERHKLEHGRDRRGEKSPHSKLTNQEAERIREMVAGGSSRRAVAAHLGMAESSIRRIVNGARYK
jgi:hypothetical protein